LSTYSRKVASLKLGQKYSQLLVGQNMRLAAGIRGF
jgi:hypothetical protein